MDPPTLSYLWDRLSHDRPKTVVEYGAGVSTLVLAKGLATLGAGRLVTLEQNEDVASEVRSLLASHGLDGWVRMLWAPVRPGKGCWVDSDMFQDALEAGTIDWIVIDGPAGPDGIRDGTLPWLLPYVTNPGRWFLDDAWRTSELGALSQWTALPGVAVEGILPIGKGLATGTCTRAL